MIGLGLSLARQASANRVNALRYSETIATAGVAAGIWTVTNAAGTLDAGTGAYAINEGAAVSTVHIVAQVPNSTILPTGAAKFTARLAADTASRCLVAGANAGVYVQVNLATGAQVATAGTHITAPTIVSAGTIDGHQFYDITIHYTHTAGNDVRVYVDNDTSSIVYTGTNRQILMTRAWSRPASVTTGYVRTDATADP